MPQQAISLPIQRRVATIVPASINSDAKTVDVVWTTGQEVRRYDWARDAIFYEELEVSEKAIRMGRMNNGASVLNSHQSYDLNSVIGVVQSASIADGEGRATLLIDDSDAASETKWKRIEKGIIRHISVGYAVHEFIERKEDNKRILLATDWEPYEVSFVPIGADAGAGVRSAPLTELPCKVVRTGDEMSEKVEGEEGGKTPVDNADTRSNPDQQPANPAADAQPDPPAVADEQRSAGDESAEILEICELAGADVRSARDFIARKMSPKDVRAALVARKSNETDETVSAHHQSGISESRSAKLDPVGIYKRYNGQEAKHG